MNQVDLLVLHGMILTQDAGDTILEDGGIAIDGGKIIAVGPSSELEKQYSGKELVNARRKAVLPGFVNTHFHFTQNFMKGTRDDYDLLDWIDKVSFPRIRVSIDQYRRGSAEIHQLAAMHAGIDLLSSGITCTANMEWGMRPGITEAYDRLGMRILNILTLTDVDSWTPPDAIIPVHEVFGLARSLQEAFAGTRSEFVYGIACPNSVTEEMILRTMREAEHDGSKIHIHLAETKYEYDRLMKEKKLSPTAYLQSLGLWDSDVWTAHSIWLDDDDIRILADHGTGVAHNPKCNMKIADGPAPIRKMLDAGVPVGLGIDSCAVSDNTDFFETMRAMVFLQRLTNMDPKSVLGREALRAATIGGAEVLGKENEIGSIEKGKEADILIVDLSGINTRPYNDIVNNLVFAANSSNIEKVIIGGETIVEKGVFARFDKDSVLDEVEQRAAEIYREANISLPGYFAVNGKV